MKIKHIVKFLAQDFPYMDTTKGKLLLVGFSSFFAAVFVWMYRPFNIDYWGIGSLVKYILIGMAFLLISQFALRFVFGLRKLKVRTWILWSLLEITAITLAIYASEGFQGDTFLGKLAEYSLSLKYVGLVMAVPYIMVFWFLAFGQRSFIRKGMAMESTGSGANDHIIFKGEKGKVILTVRLDQLLFIKSAGNYLEIYYLRQQELVRELVRASLKEVESKIFYPKVLRIHRSYIVNLKHVTAIKKTQKGYQLTMIRSTGETLPVSTGYKTNFEKAWYHNVSNPLVTN